MFTDSVNYVAGTFGKDALKLEVPDVWTPKPMPNSPFWTRTNQVFDVENFMYAAPPVDIGYVGLNSLKRENTCCLRMPVKDFGATEIVLPKEFSWLTPVVMRIMMFDSYWQASFKGYYAHLTVDTRLVDAGDTQRVSGWHVDGFQSGGRESFHEVERSYLWSADDPATEYALQPFFVDHLRMQQHNVHAEFDKQWNVPAMRGLAGHIYAIDPYMVHRSPVMAETKLRTILRVTFAKTLLTDPVNTVNEALPKLNRPDQRYELRNVLSTYPGAVPYDRYGFTRTA